VPRPVLTRFPGIEPYAQGMLDVGDGQQLYWETCGNPDGKPAVVLHGGPGSGCTPTHRGNFDPALYRIVLFDQRGAGRSTPHASAADTDLSVNTTHHLVADIERLRTHLGIDSWLVNGASWGVSLGLLYAQRHPDRVSEMVLSSITLTRPADIHWLYHDVGRYFPEQWSHFRAGVPIAERGGDLVAAYHRLVNEQPDPEVRENAARAWCDWEDAVLSLEEGWSPNPRYDDPNFRMAFTRLVTHYFHHHAWLDDNQLLAQADRLAGIPGVLVHGRADLGGPVDAAWQLARAWPGAELHVVGTGHAGGNEMTSRIVEATNRFARSS
jgi:proline iminopeptidase